MPFTSNKGFSVPVTGSLAGTWGSDSSTPTANSSNALNEGVTSLIDQALGGVTSLTVASTAVDLTQAQAQNAMLRITGTLTANVVISPNSGVLMIGFYYFENLTSGAFTVTFTNSAGSVVIPQGRRGTLWVDTTNGPRVVALVGSDLADALPTGTRVVFYNASVPTGWTAISLSGSDYLVRLVDNGGGGIGGGTLSFSTVFTRTTTDNTTLTLAQIPSHSHNYDDYSVANAGQGTTGAGGISQAAATATVRTTVAAGSGGAHNHGMDMRVLYLNMVVGTRV